MIQIEWTFELIALLVCIYVLTLVLAAVIARRMDGARNAYIDLLSKKVESLDEQLIEFKQDSSDLGKKFLKATDDLERLSSQQQKLETIASGDKTFSSESEQLLASHSKEIKKLHDSIIEFIDSFDEMGLEAIRMELHLARFAIRKGRHLVEEITRNVRQDLKCSTEDELEIEKKPRKSAVLHGKK